MNTFITKLVYILYIRQTCRTNEQFKAKDEEDEIGMEKRTKMMNKLYTIILYICNIHIHLVYTRMIMIIIIIETNLCTRLYLIFLLYCML